MLSEIRYPGQDWQIWQRSPDGEIEMECVGGRHYAWFGILGGVRHRHEKPIAEHRGLPEDVSAEAKEYLHDDYHSHTWCTLWELEWSIDILESESEFDEDDEEEREDKGVRSIGPIFYPPNVYESTVDARPIRLAYDNLCAECDLLDIPKPEIRMIVAFDS